MRCEVIKIDKYNKEKEAHYREVLKTFNLPCEFSILPKQKFDRESKSVFLMTSEFSRKWFGIKRARIVGYGIVEDAFDFPREFREHLIHIYKIPADILQKHNIVISDFMISRKERKKGHGVKLANHILGLYTDQHISLFADGDSQWFWTKMGFGAIGDNSRVYVKYHQI